MICVIDPLTPDNHRWCPNGGPVLDHHGRKVKCNSTRPCPNGYSCWDQACCPTIEVTTTELPVTFLNCNDDTVPIGVDCTFYDTCVELGCLDGLYCLTQNISIGNTYLLDGSCVQNPCWNSMPLVNEHQITSLCNLDSPGTLECPDQYTCTPVQDDVEGRSVCCPWEPTTVTNDTEREGQCPYVFKDKGTYEYKCGSDLSCKSDLKCCSNGFGTECMLPVNLTMCQHQRKIAFFHLQKSVTKDIYIPECNENGLFKDKQCNLDRNQCWCVDFRGFEISQSRTDASDLDCKKLSHSGSCPLYKCKKDCEHGFKLDQNGCRTCTCIDPCESINCTDAWEACRLIDVKCSNGWPCSRVPVCHTRPFDPCSNSSKITNCGLVCRFGYVYDNKDCALCECHNPCKKLKCEHPTICHVKQVQCFRAPCLPIAQCE
ncbi:hypothetical protein FQA39_LY13635 [Lamprigera yunnana]|nr:hypothetical protein FQA39_LY13635 [Lamprigera yunnana]